MVDDEAHVYWMRGGVDIFFVISGFVMVRSTSSRDISPGEFMAQRVQRIVPLYWIATVAAMMQVQGQWSLKLHSLFFIPAMNPKINMVQPILEPGWTLNYEMFFYLIFSLSLFLKESYRFIAVSTLFALLLIVGKFVEGGVLFEFYCRPIVIEFILGMAIAKYGIRLPLAAVPFGLFIMFFLQSTAMDRVYALGIPAMLVVAGALSAEDRLPKWKLADILGSASYSIYLFHLLALGIIVQIWPYLDFGKEIFVIASFGFILLIGCGIYWVLERPIIGFFSSRRHRHKDNSLKPERMASAGH